jgi:hypothetical protein
VVPWRPVTAPEPDLREIEKSLKFDLNRAREHLFVATQRFNAWAAVVESGPNPSPGMLSELQRLDIEQSRAGAELEKALLRFNDFKFRGILPEEFR